MMAYESHLQPGARPPGAVEAAAPAPGTAAKKAQVTRRPDGVLEQRTDNLYMIPIAFTEVILLIVMIVMNYLFRFNVSVRDSSSLVDYQKVSLSPSDVLPARQYFNYSQPITNQDSGSFGITFSMEEYAFFVPVFILPLLLILVVELVFMRFPKGHLKTVTSFDISAIAFVRRSLRIYYVYLFYASLTGMVTSFIKLLVVKPRPHFLAVCNAIPDMLAKDMFPVSECTNNNWSNMSEALRSFPSYHATIAFYAGTFLVLYLMYMLQLKGTYSMGGLFSLPVMVMAIIGGLHRWCTYHADSWDVAWGAVIGIVGALWAVHGILNSFQERVWTLNLDPAQPKLPAAAPLKVKNPSIHSGLTPSIPGYIGDTDKVMRNTPKPDLYADGRRPNRIQRVQIAGIPPPSRAPAQAFNAGFENEPESPMSVAPPYNIPRQRYSVPAMQMRPATSRPPSAHPSLGSPRGRPVSRYEGTSYF